MAFAPEPRLAPLCVSFLDAPPQRRKRSRSYSGYIPYDLQELSSGLPSPRECREVEQSAEHAQPAEPREQASDPPDELDDPSELDEPAELWPDTDHEGDCDWTPRGSCASRSPCSRKDSTGIASWQGFFMAPAPAAAPQSAPIFSTQPVAPPLGCLHFAPAAPLLTGPPAIAAPSASVSAAPPPPPMAPPCAYRPAWPCPLAAQQEIACAVQPVTPDRLRASWAAKAALEALIALEELETSESVSKAETDAGSTSATESGESNPAASRPGSCESASADEPEAGQQVTTLMLRNLPVMLSQRELLREIQSSGFGSQCDFCYMPRNFKSGENRGHAFVNFVSTEAAAEFREAWRARRLSGSHQGRPGISISNAALQGLAANIAKWDNPRMRRVRNPDFQPYIQDGTKETARAQTL